MIHFLPIAYRGLAFRKSLVFVSSGGLRNLPWRRRSHAVFFIAIDREGRQPHEARQLWAF